MPQETQVYYNNGNQGCTVLCSLMRKGFFFSLFSILQSLPGQCKTFSGDLTSVNASF